MSVAQLVEMLGPYLMLTYDAERGWHLMPAPPELVVGRTRSLT
jgi:hypothetical protein